MQIKRSFCVSDTVSQELVKRFPDVEFSLKGKATHPHPMGALERAIAEAKLLEDIDRSFGVLRVVDIGGNANRHAAAGRKNIHSCNPVLCPSDVARRSPENYRVDAVYCNNNVFECMEPADVYLAVHSLYYLTPDQVLSLVMRSGKQRLYACVHVFSELYGKMHFNGDYYESSYQVFAKQRRLSVQMDVVGNLHGYTHDAMFWLQGGYYSNGKEAMAWEGYQVGDTWNLKFLPAPLGLTPKSREDLSLVQSLDRSDHYGAINGVVSLDDAGKMKPLLEFLSIKKRAFRSLGDYIWVRNETSTLILIPKGVVKEVACKMVGVERNKEGLRKCINLMRSAVRSSKISIPAQLRLNSIIYGSAFAFIYSLEDEIDAFNRLCTPIKMRLYARLAKTMSLENFICCAGLPPVECESTVNLTVEAYNENRSSVPTGTFDAAKAWPKGLPGVECTMPLKEIRAGAKVEGGDSEKIEDKPQFFPVAMTFSQYIPVVPYASLNNETIAVVNRALMKVPEEEAVAWSFVKNTAKKWLPRFRCESENVDEELDFEEWNSRFPQAKQARHRNAWFNLQEAGFEPKHAVFNLFVKRELTLKGGSEFEDFDPRAIQGTTDEANAALGPFMRKFGKRLAEIWSEVDDIWYTSGATGEDLGRWRGQFGDDDVTILEIDQSRYDAHMGSEAHELEQEFYEEYGIGLYAFARDVYEAQFFTRGYSSKGIKYRVKYTTKSGVPYTSCGNSLINGLVMSTILRKLGIKHYKMLVLGDDNLIVIRGIIAGRELDRIINAFKVVNNSLGFSVKIKSHHSWANAEFCSSIFWPVQGGFVLGPKIGRQLPKLGFSLRALSDPDVKGMMLGWKKQVKYIPVLRQYVALQLKMLGGVAANPYCDERAKYKSLVVEDHAITTETCDFFFDRYGIGVEEAEESFANAVNGAVRTSMVDWPLLECFISTDV